MADAVFQLTVIDVRSVRIFELANSTEQRTGNLAYIRRSAQCFAQRCRWLRRERWRTRREKRSNQRLIVFDENGAVLEQRAIFAELRAPNELRPVDDQLTLGRRRKTWQLSRRWSRRAAS